MEDNIKYKIVLKRDICIGALSCSALDPEIWEDTADGKVSIKGGTKIYDDAGEIKEEFIIIDELKDARMDGAMSCPVLAIEVFKLENGTEKKIYPKD